MDLQVEDLCLGIRGLGSTVDPHMSGSASIGVGREDWV